LPKLRASLRLAEKMGPELGRGSILFPAM